MNQFIFCNFNFLTSSVNTYLVFQALANQNTHHFSVIIKNHFIPSITSPSIQECRPAA